MNILQKIRDKAQQALTGIGNFIDRDKSMGGVQLAQGGLGNKVSSFIGNQAQEYNNSRQVAGQGVGKLILQSGQSVARSFPGVIQTATKAAAPLFGVDRANIPDQVPVSELFPGRPRAQHIWQRRYY
jgi:hypothetical protein